MTTIGTREQILDRIVAVLGGVSGVVTAARNRADLADTVDSDKFPAIIVLDGSEDMVQQIAPNKSVRMPPAIMCLKPEIFVILPQRDDATNLTLDGVPAPIGPELTLWRDLCLSALINDAILVGTGRQDGGLLTTSGQMVYRGCSTDMATGRTLWGQVQLFVDFYYVWIPPTA